LLEKTASALSSALDSLVETAQGDFSLCIGIAISASEDSSERTHIDAFTIRRGGATID
jgi:hypothetical protein